MFGELNARERISYRFNVNFFFLSLSFTVMNFDVSLWCDVSSVDELFFTFSFEGTSAWPCPPVDQTITIRLFGDEVKGEYFVSDRTSKY